MLVRSVLAMTSFPPTRFMHLTADELENLEYTLKHERGPGWTCQLSDEEAEEQLTAIAREVAERDREFDVTP